ncbi:uncharacterized protein EKO05_0009003 [Ascochyta rabiei]|uniref:uncharacterized protein n=1 Tax=Didymella rabiei TaxID=5454 RepID=UPI0022039835|nr:uncharacterized protein EKO05_0009003 [Ascochyta rabiei]UPX18711.1 hypothetical protein EKO05_0009003 [Ascochyta rabiei]
MFFSHVVRRKYWVLCRVCRCYLCETTRSCPIPGVFTRYVPPAIDAINTYYDHGDIPIAIQKPLDNNMSISVSSPHSALFLTATLQTRNPTFPRDNEYLTGLTFNFPQDIGNGSNTKEPVALYRRLLATSLDHSIMIANISFHDNLYNLLLSPPDKTTPLSGPKLIKNKNCRASCTG